MRGLYSVCPDEGEKDCLRQDDLPGLDALRFGDFTEEGADERDAQHVNEEDEVVEEAFERVQVKDKDDVFRIGNRHGDRQQVAQPHDAVALSYGVDLHTPEDEEEDGHASHGVCHCFGDAHNIYIRSRVVGDTRV